MKTNIAIRIMSSRTKMLKYFLMKNIFVDNFSVYTLRLRLLFSAANNRRLAVWRIFVMTACPSSLRVCNGEKRTGKNDGRPNSFGMKFDGVIYFFVALHKQSQLTMSILYKLTAGAQSLNSHFFVWSTIQMLPHVSCNKFEIVESATHKHYHNSL